MIGNIQSSPKQRRTNLFKRTDIDTKPQSDVTHREAMTQIVGRQLSSEEPILKIDQDPTNKHSYNLFLCGNYNQHSTAQKQLNHLLTQLIKKGFIYFSKGTGSYRFSKAIQKLLKDRPNIPIYKFQPINHETDQVLYQLEQLIKLKAKEIAKTSNFTRNNHRETTLPDSQDLSFDMHKGYQKQMERMMGRRLKEGERVHHVDHNHSNNFDFNLYLCKDEEHHTAIHQQLARLSTILIRKGLIQFSKRHGQYHFSKELRAILNIRRTITPYQNSEERNRIQANHLSQPSLSTTIDKVRQRTILLNKN